MAAIKKFPIPENIKQTRSFLGLCHFFRKFIPRYAEIIAPITDLTRGHFESKKSRVKWLSKHTETFKILKEKLTKSPVLKHFNPNLPIVIWTDASKIGIASVLLQIDEGDELLHPVSYISRRVNVNEEKYSAIELELLAIIYALETFRPYVYGTHREIWTDHAPLKYLDNLKSLSTKIQRLKSKIIDYDFTLIYRKGRLNEVCDAMSRSPVFEPPTLEQEIQKNNELTIYTVKTISILLEQLRDDIYTNIIKAIQNPELSNNIWVRKSKNYFINENQILMYKHLLKGQSKNLIALTKNRINEILNDFHDHHLSGHLGVDKTYNKIIQ